MLNTGFIGLLIVPNDAPKSVNIDKISTALHVYLFSDQWAVHMRRASLFNRANFCHKNVFSMR